MYLKSKLILLFLFLCVCVFSNTNNIIYNYQLDKNGDSICIFMSIPLELENSYHTNRYAQISWEINYYFIGQDSIKHLASPSETYMSSDSYYNKSIKIDVSNDPSLFLDSNLNFTISVEVKMHTEIERYDKLNNSNTSKNIEKNKINIYNEKIFIKIDQPGNSFFSSELLYAPHFVEKIPAYTPLNLIPVFKKISFGGRYPKQLKYAIFNKSNKSIANGTVSFYNGDNYKKMLHPYLLTEDESFYIKVTYFGVLIDSSKKIDLKISNISFNDYIKKYNNLSACGTITPQAYAIHNLSDSNIVITVKDYNTPEFKELYGGKSNYTVSYTDSNDSIYYLKGSKLNDTDLALYPKKGFKDIPLSFVLPDDVKDEKKLGFVFCLSCFDKDFYTDPEVNSPLKYIYSGTDYIYIPVKRASNLENNKSIDYLGGNFEIDLNIYCGGVISYEGSIKNEDWIKDVEFSDDRRFLKFKADKNFSIMRRKKELKIWYCSDKSCESDKYLSIVDGYVKTYRLITIEQSPYNLKNAKTDIKRFFKRSF